jgi:hypothetical protein
MTELNWDWSVIAVVLIHRVAPQGLTLTRHDLHELPMERVLLEDRHPHEIRFSWVTLQAAQSRAATIAMGRPRGVPKASVSQLQGRWQKIGCVLLWKFCKDGIILTERDRDALPTDRVLLAHGHENDIELRFAPRSEAVAIQKRFDGDPHLLAEHL